MSVNAGLVFLAIAAAIVALALLLSRIFGRKRRINAAQNDPNGDPRDGNATATWIGIDQSGDQ